MHTLGVSQPRRIVHRAPLGLGMYIADPTTPTVSIIWFLVSRKDASDRKVQHLGVCRDREGYDL